MANLGTDSLTLTITQYFYESDIMHGGRGGKWNIPFFKISIKRKVDPTAPPKTQAQVTDEIAKETQFINELV